VYQIIPAIIPTSTEHLVDFLTLFRHAPKVQVDLVDGRFVSNISWPYLENSDIAALDGKFDPPEIMLDLMVKEPNITVEKWLVLGVSEVVLHLESLPDIDKIAKLKSQHNFRLYLTADNNVPISEYRMYGEVLDGFQLMGIDEVGEQGSPYDPRVIENIKELRSYYPQKTIVVDGGVKSNNILDLKNAGADQFVVGSAITEAPDPLVAYRELRALVQG
tara:strand:- start:245 stop:898 length:654 start_codon:yes stop_codon:yes gene_type:complete